MPSKRHNWTGPAKRKRPQDKTYVSLIAHQPDDRPHIPAGMGLKAQNWVMTPPKPLASERPRTGLTYADKMAVASARWDADRGAGIARTPKGTPQPQGFTARKRNPNAKQAKGISQAALDNLAGQRAWAR